MADPAKWTFPPRSEVKRSKEPKKLLSAIMASATPARDLLKQEEDFGLNLNNNNNKSDVAAPRRLTFEGDVIPLTKEVRDKLAELSLNNNNAEKSSFLKIKKPDTKFDGTETAFSDWCYRWTFFFHFSDPPLDEPTKVALAVTALTGHAFNWWRRQFELDPDIATSWDDLVAAMRAEFVASDHDYRAITKLEKLTQTGSVEHYNRAFMEIYFTIGKLDSDHAKHLYMKGLTDFLRNYVRSESAILPLNALMDFTSDIAEKFSVLAITPVKKYDGGSVGQTSTKKFGKKKFNANVVCHHCGKPGHIRPECRMWLREKSTLDGNVGSIPNATSGVPTNTSTNTSKKNKPYFNNNNNNNNNKKKKSKK